MLGRIGSKSRRLGRGESWEMERSREGKGGKRIADRRGMRGGRGKIGERGGRDREYVTHTSTDLSFISLE